MSVLKLIKEERDNPQYMRKYMKIYRAMKFGGKTEEEKKILTQIQELKKSIDNL